MFAIASPKPRGVTSDNRPVARTLLLRFAAVFFGLASAMSPRVTSAQALTGALIGTVKDEQGGVIAGARVRLSSPALLGGPESLMTNQRGQLRFPTLPPGSYLLDIEFPGFATWHEEDIRIGLGATIERVVVLRVAGVSDSVVVKSVGSRIDARDAGFSTRFGPEDLRAIPTRRASMFDFIRAVPGISPTSPSSGTKPQSGIPTTVSAFGSGTNENAFLIDGTNFTCPCSGIARAEPGVDFIQEIHVQSVGASAEFGNMQGAVINIVTRQGGERLLYDAAYYGQTAGLTSQPVRLRIPGSNVDSGYERIKYRDFTTDVGGPLVRNRLWFFTGYQHVRDYDSQPGTEPTFPRTYKEDKVFGKLTWRLAPGWQLVQSVHDQFWLNPTPPTRVLPFEATTRVNGSVPAITFGHLTHTISASTLWDVRVGRFVYTFDDPPSTGDRTTASHSDWQTPTVPSVAPSTFGALTIARTTVKTTIEHYEPGFLAADHQWKIGGQVERGEHDAFNVIPTGVKYVDKAGQPYQSVSSAPSVGGGRFITAAAFASDAITIGARLTVNAGVRFDHTRAISQDLHAVDLEGRETDAIVRGLGTLYTWNIVSPRLGVTTKLTADGRTVLRASYGRFSQSVLTGEFEQLHPGRWTPVVTNQFDPATGGYTTRVSLVDQSNVLLDPRTRAPRTDEYSIGLDREVGRRLVFAAAYVRKNGANFIGWTDIGGQYRDETRPLPDGRLLPVFALENATSDRRFLLTNPQGYSLTYDGLVMAVEKRRSRWWQAFGSYTLSRAYGLQPNSGTTAAGPQSSTVGPPTMTNFGRDPNDLTNARGRLANDRPHVLRVMSSVDIPRTGLAIAANLQHFSGKPWAATAQLALPQGLQRVLLETRGSRRLSSQSLLDFRISRPIAVNGVRRIDLLFDVLNALNDTAEESLGSDTLSAPNFGLPTVFMDPRRAMFGVRVNLGR